MSNLQTIFRRDTMSGIFQLTGKVWLPVTVAYALTSVISLLLIAPVLLNIFGFDMTMLQDLASGTDPQEQLERMTALMESAGERFLQPANLAIIILVSLAAAIISMYVINVAFVTNEAHIRGERISIGQSLSGGFNSDVFRLFLVYLLTFILIGVVYVLIVAVVGLVAATLDITLISVLLGLAGFIGLMMFSMKFLLAMPAVVHGDMGIGQALGYSFRTISWKKSGKYVLIGIVVGIALLVAVLIATMVQGLFAFIPVIGPVLSQIVGVVISGFISAFIYAALSALYFKRTDDIATKDDLDDHLILDD